MRFDDFDCPTFQAARNARREVPVSELLYLPLWQIVAIITGTMCLWAAFFLAFLSA